MIVPTRSDDEGYTAIQPPYDDSRDPQSPETDAQDGEDTRQTKDLPTDFEDTTHPTPTEGTPLEPTKEECSQSATDIFSEDPELGLPETDAGPKHYQSLPLVFHVVGNTIYFLGALIVIHLSALFPHFLVYQLLGPNTDASLRFRFAIYAITSWSSCVFFAGATYIYWKAPVYQRREEGDESGERGPQPEGDDTLETFQAAMGRSFVIVEIIWAGITATVFALSLFIFFSNAAWKVLGGMAAPA